MVFQLVFFSVSSGYLASDTMSTSSSPRFFLMKITQQILGWAHVDAVCAEPCAVQPAWGLSLRHPQPSQAKRDVAAASHACAASRRAVGPTMQCLVLVLFALVQAGPRGGNLAMFGLAWWRVSKYC